MNLTKKKIGRTGLRLAIAVAGLFGAQAAFAQYVSEGGTIRLDNGPGAGPGGEFRATVLSGGSGTFETFCLERIEYFSYGQALQVRSISSGAMNGGVSGGSGGVDLLDSRTAYLYTQFRNSTLSSYDYSNATLRAGDADNLQNAIWFIEGEITSVSGQAQTWVAEAGNAVSAGSWSGLGNVQALNLWRESSVGSGNFNTVAQDQLYITPVPEPETYMMLLAGLGLMGFVARRRRRSFAA